MIRSENGEVEIRWVKPIVSLELEHILTGLLKSGFCFDDFAKITANAITSWLKEEEEDSKNETD